MANSSAIVDHGSLEDRNHPNYEHDQYMQRGDDILTGNLTVSDGVEIDGVDPSLDVALWGLI